jgi:hypothetical protein
MAYDYIGIINEVLKALNEVEITSTDFSSLTGFHAHVKDKVNVAIADIYAEEDNEWPFALTEGSQAVTVGFTGAVDGAIPEYTVNASAASVDWDSFYITRNDALTDGYEQELTLLPWDKYRKYNRTSDANSETDSHGKPKFVTRKQDNKFVLSPLSKYAYTVKYDYFAKPTYLSASTDTPVIPELYKQVLIDKVTYYAYMFRDNVEEADRADDKYEKGVNRMRRALIPQSDTLRAD